MRSNHRTPRPVALAAAALAASATLLTGCALLEGPTPATPEREAVPVPEEAPEFFPDGSAEDNLPYFTEVLRDYADGDGAVRGAPIVDAVVDAGFDVDDMQVSFDRTKTNLDADNIFVSVRIDADCLIGQIVADDRSFVAEVEPAVGPDGDLCLIGETRAIDW